PAPTSRTPSRPSATSIPSPAMRQRQRRPTPRSASSRARGRWRRKGAQFLAELREALAGVAVVGDVRGSGHWLAIDFTADPATKAPAPDGFPAEVVRRMAAMGVIACTTGTSIELAPPLIATEAQLSRAAEIAGRAVREAAQAMRVG